MKKRLQQGFALALLFITLASFENTKIWTKTGSNISQYEMGDKVSGNNEGAGIISIKSKTNSVSGYGVLMNQLPASSYVGKRVRISAIVKSKDVSEWGGLWLDVNRAASQNVSLEGMQHSVTIGSSKGYNYSQVVLDVPTNSKGISYGAVLKGSGQIFIGRVNFEIVANDVPLTN